MRRKRKAMTMARLDRRERRWEVAARVGYVVGFGIEGYVMLDAIATRSLGLFAWGVAGTAWIIGGVLLHTRQERDRVKRNELSGLTAVEPPIHEQVAHLPYIVSGMHEIVDSIVAEAISYGWDVDRIIEVSNMPPDVIRRAAEREN